MDQIDLASDGTESFDKLIEEAKYKIKNCPEPVYIRSNEFTFFRKFGWSDQQLEKIVASLKFPKKVFDLRNFKSIITHFFHFYFTGKIEENWTVQSTVFSAISLFNVPDKNRGYTRIFDEKYIETEEIKSFYKWSGKTNCISLDDIYVFGDLYLFVYEIQNILEFWNESSRITENQAKLMRLVAFLALTLCKTGNQILLMGTFKSKDYRQILSDYVGWNMKKAYCSPNAECIRKCYELKDTPINPIYAIVVREWTRTKKTDTVGNNKLTQALLYKSLLQGTEGFGIEVIKTLGCVLAYTQRTFEELMEIICVIEPDITKFSDWQTLIHFHKKFFNKENQQYSFLWARLIDNTYFQECSMEECSFVSATFASIIEFKVGTITWNAAWARLRPELTRRGLVLGRMIHEVLMDTGKLFRKLFIIYL